MQQTKQYLILTLAILMVTICGVSTFAEYSSQTISKEFAGMNGGRGYIFDTSLPGNLPMQGFDLVANPIGLDVYYNHRFWSIDLSAGGTCDGIYWGKLSPYPFTDTYSGYSQTNEGVYLTLGAAYLYKQYATGAFPNAFTDPYDWRDISDAIRAAMRIVVLHPDPAIMYYYWNLEWEDNPYTAALLAENDDKTYWLQQYDSTWRYDEIGDYCVYVLNFDAASSTYSIPKGDWLYIAEGTVFRNDGGGGGVPEPATLLLWTLGSMGLAGTSWARKRRMKKST